MSTCRATFSKRCPPNFLDVTPGFFETMRIGLLAGREFRPGDIPAHLEQNNRPVEGVGIVNETFARVFFDGRNPVGQSVEIRAGKAAAKMSIVELVRDAAYRDIREPIPATSTFHRGTETAERSWSEPPAIPWQWPRGFCIVTHISASSSSAAQRDISASWNFGSQDCLMWGGISSSRASSRIAVSAALPASAEFTTVLRINETGEWTELEV